MEEFYNSEEMFDAASLLSNDNFKEHIQNNLYILRQACKNVFSRICMDGPYDCYIYMDNGQAQGLSDAHRVICTSIFEEEGITIFKTEDSEYEFDDLDTDTLVDMIQQL